MRDATTASVLASVRRLEAVGFRAWPAEQAIYDGSWLIRLTRAHPSKRLNSLNPLDPGDRRDIAGRLKAAGKRFAAAGRPLTIRMTPLAPPELLDHLHGEGFERFDESIVMSADLSQGAGEGLDQLPLRDINRFIDARLAISGEPESLRAGLCSILAAIKPETGLFLLQSADRPSAVALAVLDGELIGLEQVAVAEAERGQGLGKAVVQSALRWGHLHGARMAWLAVGAANAPALALYRKLGFSEVYRYAYFRERNEA
ncbi:GNAT family N-acetyltransferase [Xaviernesmea oryzae]|uniref:GNAT family N-acetyltransferase n=1 Tax=Xaviernesmea oryzae TaxID=464029 RepID=A0A1Q9B2A7_9HYPH|nr:GNAT family N-acetyltransferase [Xaviernesmea oryzae]OLP62153.1 GNAT family N-acetyltransferase [Xaviernesmea oryzae]SEL89244.1 Acetyltransferase (GNAT) family protein [Xaviernesmea oryzae]